MALQKKGAGGAEPDFTSGLGDFHSLCERESSSSQERTRIQSGGIDVSVDAMCLCRWRRTRPSISATLIRTIHLWTSLSRGLASAAGVIDGFKILGLMISV